MGHFPPIKLFLLPVLVCHFFSLWWKEQKNPSEAFLYVFFLQIAALDYANKLIVKYLPGLKVFPAVGNHEGAPVNRLIKFIHWQYF